MIQNIFLYRSNKITKEIDQPQVLWKDEPATLKDILGQE